MPRSTLLLLQQHQPHAALVLPHRAFAGGFFDQLKKSFNKEVERNKEFKESLSKLRKETGDLTGKAQEGTSKLTESMQKYTSAFSSKLSETTETLSKSSQTMTSTFTELKEKITAAADAAKEKEKQQEEEDMTQAKATAAEPHPAQETTAPPPPRQASASARRRRAKEETEEGAKQQQKQHAADETTANASSTTAQEEDAGGEKQQQQQQDGEEQQAKTEGAAAPDANASFFSKLTSGRPSKEAVVAWAGDFQVGLKEAFADLFGMQKKSTGMKKHIYQQPLGDAAEKKEGEEDEGVEQNAEAEKQAGGGALVVVKQQQKTWERLAEQLKDAPIIQEILKAGTKLADTELGRQAGKIRGKLNDRVEDAREMWETSQNPLVYKLSSMWDDLTSETELGIALREIRRADPEFVLEDWVNTLSESFLPLFFEAYLKGDLKTLKPYLSEGMYKQIAEEFRLRKAEGLQLDPNVLEISNAEIVQAKIHDHQPVLVLGTLIQHINCVRNRDGKIVEGKEDEVRASFYLLLFVRDYDEKEGALQWKIQERYLGFSQPFI